MKNKRHISPLLFQVMICAAVRRIGDFNIMKILFAASEGLPFVQTGGLGDVIGALPKSIVNANPDFDVRVVLPLYESIDRSELEFLCYIYLPLSWRNQYCGIFGKVVEGVTYYFIDNEYYFKRASCYGHYDDGERFAFFSKAVLEILPAIDFYPDVIHAHDWQTALVPIYLRTVFAGREHYDNIKSIFTIHNIEYQGKYDKAILGDIFGLADFDYHIVEFDGCINLMKGALECADRISTVSPTYAEEIKSPYYSHGLSPIILNNSGKLNGILNGIDINFYNPSIDKDIFKTYNINSIDKKAANKKGLQEMLGLPVNANIPLVAIISRLVSHKGIDIVAEAAENLLCNNIQLVILGKGDRDYEVFFENLQRRYPNKVVAYIAFEPQIAKKIYAAADMFLMPSKSEPCGLAQMIASRYGTVPIVRETGGLKDSIHDCTLGEGNGFTFVDYTADNISNAINRALNLYYDKKNWNNLVTEVMNTDFSWNNSALEYINMYKSL